MKDSATNFDENSRIEAEASIWLARLDRGLSAEEQDRYVEWLSKDAAHRTVMAQYQMDWEDYDRLAGIHLKSHARLDPDLLKPHNWNKHRMPAVLRKVLWYAAVPIAALLVIGLYLAVFTGEGPFTTRVEPALELLARIEQRRLDDGSTVEINRGSVIEVAYTNAERRVYLRSGEAVFKVAKDPHRPFIVNAASVDVKAIGTIFNVKMSGTRVDVIVTEGKVNLKLPSGGSPADHAEVESFVGIGQKATVQLQSEVKTVEIIDLDEAQIREATNWQPRLLDYESITLGELVGEFNRSNPIQVQFGDPSLEAISLSSSFWSDNVEGFIRLMESSFGMQAEWRGSREIILNRKAI